VWYGVCMYVYTAFTRYSSCHLVAWDVMCVCIYCLLVVCEVVWKMAHGCTYIVVRDVSHMQYTRTHMLYTHTHMQHTHTHTLCTHTHMQYTHTHMQNTRTHLLYTRTHMLYTHAIYTYTHAVQKDTDLHVLHYVIKMCISHTLLYLPIKIVNTWNKNLILSNPPKKFARKDSCVFIYVWEMIQ